MESYYETAPEIVRAIDRSLNAEKVYLSLWENYLKPCLKLLENRNFPEVKRLYTEMVENLRRKYLNRK